MLETMLTVALAERMQGHSVPQAPRKADNHLLPASLASEAITSLSKLERNAWFMSHCHTLSACKKFCPALKDADQVGAMLWPLPQIREPPNIC